MRFVYLACLAALVGLGVGACSSEEPEDVETRAQSGGSGGAGASDSNDGARASGGADAGSVATTRQPISIWEPDLPTEGTFCSALVAVECDGDEDCAAGQICCGTLNGGSFSYDSVRCEDSCDRADGGYEICHAGEACDNPEHECIRSLILPSYLGICNTPSPFTPEGFDGVSEAAGEINCAPGLVCSGGDVCCALTSWDAETEQAAFIDGRCAPTPEACGCSSGSAPVPAGAARVDGDGTAPDGGAGEPVGRDGAADAGADGGN